MVRPQIAMLTFWRHRLLCAGMVPLESRVKDRIHRTDKGHPDFLRLIDHLTPALPWLAVDGGKPTIGQSPIRQGRWRSLARMTLHW
jgi:hypothetical protein